MEQITMLQFQGVILGDYDGRNPEYELVMCQKVIRPEFYEAQF